MSSYSRTKVPGHVSPTGPIASAFLTGIPKPEPERWRNWIHLALEYADENGMTGQEREDWISMVTGL